MNLKSLCAYLRRSVFKGSSAFGVTLAIGGSLLFSSSDAQSQSIPPAGQGNTSGLIGGAQAGSYQQQGGGSFKALDGSFLQNQAGESAGMLATADGKLQMCQMSAEVQASQKAMQNSMAAMQTAGAGSPGAAAFGAAGGAFSSAFTGASAGAGAAQGAAGFTGDCDATEVTDPGVGTSCDAYKDMGPPVRFNEMKFAAGVQSLKTASGVAACQQMKASMASEYGRCFGNYMGELKAVMEKQKQIFDLYDQGIEEYKGHINAAIETEDQKQQAIAGKTQSLAAAKERIYQRIQELRSASDKSLAKMKQANTDYMNRKLTFQNRVEAQKVQRTHSCFQQGGATSSRLVCPVIDSRSKTASQLSPRDCVFSVFERTEGLKYTGGQAVKTGSSAAGRAQISRQMFENEVNGMLRDLTGENPRAGTYTRFKSQYKTRIEKYGAAGKQLVAELDECNSQANSDIKVSLEKGDLFQEKTQLNTEGNTLAAQMSEQYEALRNPIRDSIRELTGKEVGGLYQPQGCGSVMVTSNAGATSEAPQSLASQVDCLGKMTRLAEQMYDGSGGQPAAMLELPVPGMPNGKISCSNLRDCEQTLVAEKAKSDTKVAQMKGSSTFPDPKCAGGMCPGIKKVHLDANKSKRQAIQTMAGEFKLRMKDAQFKMDQMNAIFGMSVGAEFTSKDVVKVDMNKVCPVKDDAVCQPEQSMSELISGLNGMPLLEKSDFATASAKAREKASSSGKIAGDMRSKLMQLQSLDVSCRKSINDEAVRAKLGQLQGLGQGMLADCSMGVTAGGMPPAVGSQFSDLQKQISDVCYKEANPPADCQTAIAQTARLNSQCSVAADDAWMKAQYRNEMYKKAKGDGGGKDIHGK